MSTPTPGSSSGKAGAPSTVKLTLLIDGDTFSDLVKRPVLSVVKVCDREEGDTDAFFSACYNELSKDFRKGIQFLKVHKALLRDLKGLQLKGPTFVFVWNRSIVDVVDGFEQTAVRKLIQEYATSWCWLIPQLRPISNETLYYQLAREGRDRLRAKGLVIPLMYWDTQQNDWQYGRNPWEAENLYPSRYMGSGG
eukprot:tig00000444_g796.t1